MAIMPSPASLASIAQAEVVTQPLYDSETIANGATQAIFFDGTYAGNRLLTNVDQNGQLPHPKFFRIGGIRLVPDMPCSSGAQKTVTDQVADLGEVLFGTYYTLTLGDLKTYLVVPAFFLPAGLGPVLRSGNTTAYTLNNGYEAFGSFLRLKHWISLPPLQSFQAKLEAPTALFLTATMKFWNILDGEYGREVL